MFSRVHSLMILSGLLCVAVGAGLWAASREEPPAAGAVDPRTDSLFRAWVLAWSAPRVPDGDLSSAQRQRAEVLRQDLIEAVEDCDWDVGDCAGVFEVYERAPEGTAEALALVPLPAEVGVRLYELFDPRHVAVLGRAPLESGGELAAARAALGVSLREVCALSVGHRARVRQLVPPLVAMQESLRDAALEPELRDPWRFVSPADLQGCVDAL